MCLSAHICTYYRSFIFVQCYRLSVTYVCVCSAKVETAWSPDGVGAPNCARSRYAREYDPFRLPFIFSRMIENRRYDQMLVYGIQYMKRVTCNGYNVWRTHIINIRVCVFRVWTGNEIGNAGNRKSISNFLYYTYFLLTFFFNSPLSYTLYYTHTIHTYTVTIVTVFIGLYDSVS